MNGFKTYRPFHQQQVDGFEHFFEDVENVYIFLELCSDQTMYEMLKRKKRLTEIEAQYYVL